MHLAHTFPPYFLKIHSNIFPSTPSLPSGLLPPDFKNIVCISRLSHACYMQSHIIIYLNLCESERSLQFKILGVI